MQKIAKVIAPAIISLLLLSGCGTILKQAIDGGTDSVKGQFDKIVKDQNITAINRVTVNAAGVSVTYLKDGSYTTARLVTVTTPSKRTKNTKILSTQHRPTSLM